jgi:serine/threonine protein kinase
MVNMEQFAQDIVLDKRIGSGGMAEVFRAYHTGPGGFSKEVAVKRVLPVYSADPSMQKAFEREVRVCGHLQHPNIISVFRSGISQGSLYLVMEYVHGRNVYQIQQALERQKHRFPRTMVYHIISQAAKGLHYAHTLRDERSGDALEIVHRDIAPQNILVSYSGAVKIADFGLAISSHQARFTRHGDLKGRVPYMAPELLDGALHRPQTDVFALGVVMYELLTGFNPFIGRQLVDSMNKIRDFDVPSFSAAGIEADKGLELIVFTAMAPNPDNRYQSAEDLRVALEGYRKDNFPLFVAKDCADFLEGVFGNQTTMNAKREDLGIELERSPLDHPSLPKETGQEEEFFNFVDRLYDAAEHGELKRRSGPGYVIARIIGYSSAVILGLGVALLVVLYQSSEPVAGPTGNAKLLARFSAADLLLSDGQRVADWPGVGGLRLKAVQQDTKNQPLYRASEQSPFPWIEFDGEDDFLRADGVTAYLRQASSFSFFFVARPVRSWQDRLLISIQGPAQSNGILRAGFWQNGKLHLKLTVSGSKMNLHDLAGSYSDQPKKFQLFEVHYDGKSLRYIVDGKTVIEKMLGLPAILGEANFFSIGQEWSGSLRPMNLFEGDLADLQIYGAPLKEEEIQQIRSEIRGRFPNAPQKPKAEQPKE